MAVTGITTIQPNPESSLLQATHRRPGPQNAGVYTKAGRAKELKYAILYEPTATGYSAHVPDLPGCVAAAATLDETRQLMKEAIQGHLECMRESGYSIPRATTVAEEVEVPA